MKRNGGKIRRVTPYCMSSDKNLEYLIKRPKGKKPIRYKSFQGACSACCGCPHCDRHVIEVLEGSDVSSQASVSVFDLDDDSSVNDLDDDGVSVGMEDIDEDQTACIS